VSTHVRKDGGERRWKDARREERQGKTVKELGRGQPKGRTWAGKSVEGKKPYARGRGGQIGGALSTSKKMDFL